MEKVLLEKIANDTCDEIDKDMIVARIGNALTKMHLAFKEFEKELRDLHENYLDEMKLADVAIVCGCYDITDIDKNDIGFKCTIGSAENINMIVKSLLKEVK